MGDTLKVVLVIYRGYFQERFIEGMSMRKYAEVHHINRGSKDYL